MAQIVSTSYLKKKSWKNKKTVIVGGTFDILHPTHVYFLNGAKKYGNILIVGITSDKLVRSKKGKLRPIISAKNRALMVSGLRAVDYVFVSNKSAYNDQNIKIINPNIIVFPLEGNKTNHRKLYKEKYENKFKNLKVKFVKTTRKHSTTNIISTILGRYRTSLTNK